MTLFLGRYRHRVSGCVSCLLRLAWLLTSPPSNPSGSLAAEDMFVDTGTKPSVWSPADACAEVWQTTWYSAIVCDRYKLTPSDRFFSFRIHMPRSHNLPIFLGTSKILLHDNGYCRFLYFETFLLFAWFKSWMLRNYNVLNALYMPVKLIIALSFVKLWKKWKYFQIINTLRTRSFKFFKRPFPGFLTILTL
jgi:hypothetical protein